MGVVKIELRRSAGFTKLASQYPHMTGVTPASEVTSNG
jgi:hypothetical protein